ncbi:hypothetical protein FJ366_02285 [Candidatus Dependentiae bacterium]|nr:hypothetical protein [Candidatus Dependentiae bacterium]
MKHLNRILFSLASWGAGLLALTPNYKADLFKAESALHDMQTAKDFAEFQLSCSNQKIAHLLSFTQAEKKSLEERNTELAKKTYVHDKITAEKNNQISLLFEELQAIRKSLYEALATRNNLEKAYLELDQRFQSIQQNFSAQVKKLQSKLIASEVSQQNGLISEGAARQQVAILEQALKDNETFYTKEIYDIFNDLSKDLENTKQQLSLATDACYETENELSMVREQLTLAQKFISKQGYTPQTERELKTLQQAINKVSKQTAGSKASHHQRLAESLKKIQSLDQKLERAQQEIARNELEIKSRTAKDLKQGNELKSLNIEIARLKKEYQATTAQNSLASARMMKQLQADLATTKDQFNRSKKIVEAKDLAFSVLEKHCNNLKASLHKEEAAQQVLLNHLKTAQNNAKQMEAKVGQLESSQAHLRSLVSKTQKDLAEKTTESHALASSLKTVSKKLADAEISKENLAKMLNDTTFKYETTLSRVDKQEKEIISLETERNTYMFERHHYANLAHRLYNNNTTISGRLNSVLDAIAKNHEHATSNTESSLTL